MHLVCPHLTQSAPIPLPGHSCQVVLFPSFQQYGSIGHNRTLIIKFSWLAVNRGLFFAKLAKLLEYTNFTRINEKSDGGNDVLEQQSQSTIVDMTKNEGESSMLSRSGLVSLTKS